MFLTGWILYDPVTFCSASLEGQTNVSALIRWSELCSPWRPLMGLRPVYLVVRGGLVMRGCVGVTIVWSPAVLSRRRAAISVTAIEPEELLLFFPSVCHSMNDFIKGWSCEASRNVRAEIVQSIKQEGKQRGTAAKTVPWMARTHIYYCVTTPGWFNQEKRFKFNGML